MLNRIMLVIAVVSILVCSSHAWASQKCEGPADLCEQIEQLRSAVKKHEDAEKFASKKVEEVHMADEALAAHKAVRMQRVMEGAGFIAIILKMFLSGLKAWQSFFKTEAGKAWIRIIVIFVGLAAFITTNIGLGFSVLESMILAGGGPAAIAIHELMDLIPIITGKKKLSNPPPAPVSL